MVKIRLTVGNLLAVLFISAAVYLWSLGWTNGMQYHSPAQYGYLGQMILSISHVNLVEAGQYNLPWSGETWLINMVVNPQDAESIIAKMGYLQDTIPKEEISSGNKQAKYDLQVKIQPVTQQCIYGPDSTTMTSYVPVYVQYKEFDLGSATFSCNHASDWKTAVVEPYVNNVLKPNYDDVAYYCAYACGQDGITSKHAYVSCIFALFKDKPGVTGQAQLTLKSLYVKDRISVTAGYKTATGDATDKIDISSENPSTVLYYGSEPVGKVDLVGYLKAKDFCPEGANYHLINTGQGWKVIPNDTYNLLMGYIRPIELGSVSLASCSNIQSLDDYQKCRQAMQDYAQRADQVIQSINGIAPSIDGKPATRPSATEYSASYYFAVTPDNPVVYGEYRMYLKADWVGILVSMARPTIQSVVPNAISLTGPESKPVTVTVRNDGDQGGVIVQVTCSNNFLVDGKSTSSRTATMNKGDTRSFIFNVSYGGDGTKKAAGTCTVVAKSGANPNVTSQSTFTVTFTPKGAYPPNTTVCVTTTSYARTDSAGIIVPGTEKPCPENTYCVDTPSGAKCEAHTVIPTNGGNENNQSTSPLSNPWVLVGGIAAALVLITLIIAVAV